MLIEMIGALMAIVIGLMMVEKESVQLNLFGEAILPAKNGESKQDKVWENLRELCLSGDVGHVVERIVEGFSLNLEKGCLTLFFGDERATTLWLQPKPETLEIWPNIKAEGQKFCTALVRACGEAIHTSDDLLRLMEESISKGHSHMVLSLTKTQFTNAGGDLITYAAYRVYWVPSKELRDSVDDAMNQGGE